jgi:hypothetical protein
MKKLLTALLILVSIVSYSQTAPLYVPNNGDSISIVVKVGGVMRTIYMKDILKNRNIFYNSVASMVAAVNPLQLSLITTSGYYNKGDGGGNTYYYDSSSTATVDGGSVIAPSNNKGRLLAIFNGEINVKTFGVKGDGTTDETTAIGKAVTYINTNGGRLRFPDGTYSVKFTANGAPLYTITHANISILFSKGAVVNMSATVQPSNYTNGLKQFMFSFEGTDNATVEGGVFNGGRANAMNPIAGVARFIGTSNVKVTNCIFKDFKVIIGTVYIDSWNGTSHTVAQGISIEDNTFYRNYFPIHVRDILRDVSVQRNKILNTDLEDPNGEFFTPFGSTQNARCIRVTGFAQTHDHTRQVGNVIVSNNFIDSATFAIEVFNMNTPGLNPDSAKTVIISNNVITSLWGISCNAWSNVSINGNSISRLVMDSTQTTNYTGYHSAAFFSSANTGTGIGIEARPGNIMMVSGNSIFGSWKPNATTDYSGGFNGIDCGNAGTIPASSKITGNMIDHCFRGISIIVTQKTSVDNNTLVRCRSSLTLDSSTRTYSGTYDTTYKFNDVNITGNQFYIDSSQNIAINPVVLLTACKFTGNIFKGEKGYTYNNDIVTSYNKADTTFFVGNQFYDFNTAAINDNNLNSVYINNIYSGQSGAASMGGATFQRKASKTVVVDGDRIYKATTAYSSTGVAALGETYRFKNISIDSSVIYGWRIRTSGDTMYIPFINAGVHKIPTNNTSGYWAAGTSFFDPTPTTSGNILNICMVTGKPGTWSSLPTTLSSKQDVLSGTGIVSSTAGTISYITDNSANWNTAYSWGNHASAGYLVAANNLSDINNAATARSNLGLGNFVDKTVSNTYTAGANQIFTADATNTGLTFGGVTANPSSPANGGVWYRSDETKLHYWDGTTDRKLVAEALTQTITNKDLTSATNKFPVNTLDEDDIKSMHLLGSAIIAQTFRVDRINAGVALSANQMRFVKINIDSAQTVHGIKWYQSAQGVFTPNNENRVSLYSVDVSTGTLTLVASSTDDGTIWSTAASNTWTNKDFSSTYAASAGVYCIGFLYNSSAQTTAPAIGGFSVVNAAVWGVDFPNSIKLSAVKGSVLTLPTSLTMASIVSTTSAIEYAGVY